MHADSLSRRIHNCVTQARFTDFFRRQFDASKVRQRHEANHSCPLSTDGIDVPQPDLDALVSDRDARLGTFKSPVSGAVGNGLSLLIDSPRNSSLDR